MHIPELKTPVIVWTQTEKNRMEMAYVDGHLVGYVERKSRFLSETWEVATINEKNMTVFHGRVAGMCALDARTVAKRMLHLQIAKR